MWSVQCWIINVTQGTLNKYVEIQATSCRNIEVLDFFTFVIVLNVYVNILQYDIIWFRCILDCRTFEPCVYNFAKSHRNSLLQLRLCLLASSHAAKSLISSIQNNSHSGSFLVKPLSYVHVQSSILIKLKRERLKEQLEDNILHD